MDKGKGRQVQDVIEVSDTDTDSDTEFFMAKKRSYTKPMAPTTGAIEQPIVISDSDTDETSPKKRRKKAAVSRAPKRPLPEWTRTRKKDSASQSSRSGAVVVSSGDESPRATTTTPSKGKGKGKAVDRDRDCGRSVELTPPPELSADVQKRLKERLEAHWAEEEADEEADGAEPSSPGAAGETSSTSGPTVMITIAMVADPDRKATASAKAIQHYERSQVYHIARNSPMHDVLEVLAERVQKPTSDLLLVYEGRRLYAMSQTPGQLGIFDSATMEAYEKVIWDKLEQQRQEERNRILMVSDDEDDEDKEGANKAAGTSGAGGSLPAGSTQSAAAAGTSGAVSLPADDDSNKVRLKLRGAEGEHALKAGRDTKISTLLKYYCMKHSLAHEVAESMYIDLDGERFEGDATVEDLDVEDGDLVDVKRK